MFKVRPEGILLQFSDGEDSIREAMRFPIKWRGEDGNVSTMYYATDGAMMIRIDPLFFPVSETFSERMCRNWNDEADKSNLPFNMDAIIAEKNHGVHQIDLLKTIHACKTAQGLEPDIYNDYAIPRVRIDGLEFDARRLQTICLALLSLDSLTNTCYAIGKNKIYFSSCGIDIVLMAMRKSTGNIVVDAKTGNRVK